MTMCWRQLVRTAVFVILGILAGRASADGIIGFPFGDHMVLQRGSALVWGKADPGEKVTLAFRDVKVEAVANEQGRWRVELKTGAAGGPFELTVTGKSTVTLKDILVGEVWLGSGQSNMHMALKDGRGGVLNTDAEIAAAQYPSIRLLQIPNGQDKTDPQYTNVWTACTPESVKGFSATLYFFARRMSQELGVPVGVVNASQGGSPIDGWLPKGELYEKCIARLVPMRFAGVLWYQGETDSWLERTKVYGDRLTTLITGWRAAWGQDWPFYAVQIAPNYSLGAAPLLWEGTLRAVQTQPHTGMISTFDVGELSNIHPQNKQAVGLRLANLALRDLYGKKDLHPDSPRKADWKVVGDRIRVRFSQAEGGLATNDGDMPDWFEIAGDNQQFVWAQARLDGDTVEVWSPEIMNPVAVRFAWSGIAIPNLIGKDSRLPAFPFRTDAWTNTAVVAGVVEPVKSVTTVEALASALEPMTPYALTTGGRIIGTVRLAVMERQLAIRMEVLDGGITPEKADWSAVTIELYATTPGDAKVRQVVVPIAGDGIIRSAERFEMGDKRGTFELPMARVDKLKPKGYVFVAAVPLLALGIADTVRTFNFEASVTMTVHAGQKRNWQSLFGSLCAFKDGSRFRAMEIREKE